MPAHTFRRVPRNHWVRIAVRRARDVQPGHTWLHGCVRRDAWRIGPLGVSVARQPYERHLPLRLRLDARGRRIDRIDPPR
jgi:hypothetical protein